MSATRFQLCAPALAAQGARTAATDTDLTNAQDGTARPGPRSKGAAGVFALKAWERSGPATAPGSHPTSAPYSHNLHRLLDLDAFSTAENE
ncbi:hypothetical protein ACWEQ2_31430 [Streptomyces sp. NPDC004096]